MNMKSCRVDHTVDIQYLIDNMDTHPDFPKPGISFKDTISLFRKPLAFKKVIDIFTDYIRELNVDVIVGLEARGFIIGSAVAYNLGISFVPVRKKGKLPGKVVSYHYDLEYGQDVFEMQDNSIQAGQRVAIVDDLIATGGSCGAAIELIKQLQGEVVECVMLVELEGINWRAKIPNTKVSSFIKI